ncbi:hypothetical protein F2Q70_00035435 [Brassica cretica]|uniref:DUF4283 domain-containing protein n=1 Tax=Brassica cretica TaxID=69181 RepID=A0A8S9JRP4_BRACR|nr:hypothetical protein F2Q70_00035435 [Brassica cretica]
MSSEANCWLSSDGLASVLNPLSSAPVKPNFTFGSTASLFNLPPKSITLTSLDSPDVVMTDSATANHGSVVETVGNSKEPSLTILPPKHSPPIHTNRASSPHTVVSPLPHLLTPPVGSNLSPTSVPVPEPVSKPVSAPITHPASNHNPANSHKQQKHSTSKPQPLQSQTYASKAKILSDHSLKRLAPTTSSPEGKPRVLVPDAVFARGAALHKEYIVESFLGKMPDYGPIQSVLNFMWGKGSKLEIHLQPLKHSVLVRVPNDYIRSKILEKRLWYVDTAMFYVSQWGENPTVSYPEITSIPLWAHLRGVPFDLRTKEGLSLAAGLNDGDNGGEITGGENDGLERIDGNRL